MKKSPLQRKTRLASRSPIKKTGNRKRRQSEFARAYESRERVRFVNSLPCVIGLTCWGKMENAHVKTGGVGRKADAQLIVPLCHWHHHMIHQHGLGFYASVDFDAAAAATEQRWQEYAKRDDTLEQKAPCPIEDISRGGA